MSVRRRLDCRWRVIDTLTSKTERRPVRHHYTLASPCTAISLPVLPIRKHELGSEPFVEPLTFSAYTGQPGAPDTWAQARTCAHDAFAPSRPRYRWQPTANLVNTGRPVEESERSNVACENFASQLAHYNHLEFLPLRNCRPLLCTVYM